MSTRGAVIDPTSPIFMRGDTIHIPCVFISWTGHALDYKTPLLRAEQVLSRCCSWTCLSAIADAGECATHAIVHAEH